MDDQLFTGCITEQNLVQDKSALQCNIDSLSPMNKWTRPVFILRDFFLCSVNGSFISMPEAMGISSSYFLCIGSVSQENVRVAIRLNSLNYFFDKDSLDPTCVASGMEADFILTVPDNHYQYIFNSFLAKASLRHNLEAALSRGAASSYSAALEALPPKCAKLLAANPSCVLGDFKQRHSGTAPMLFDELSSRSSELASRFCKTTMWKGMECHICGCVPLHKPGQSFASLDESEKNAIRSCHFRCPKCGKFWCAECVVALFGIIPDDEAVKKVDEWCPFCSGSCFCKGCKQRNTLKLKKSGVYVEPAILLAGSAEAVPSFFAKNSGRTKSNGRKSKDGKRKSGKSSKGGSESGSSSSSSSASSAASGDKNEDGSKHHHHKKHHHKKHKHHHHHKHHHGHHKHDDKDGDEKKHDKKESAVSKEKNALEKLDLLSSRKRHVYPIDDELLEKETIEKLKLKNKQPKEWPHPTPIPLPSDLPEEDVVFVWNFLAVFGEEFSSVKLPTLELFSRTLFSANPDRNNVHDVAQLHSDLLNVIADPQNMQNNANEAKDDDAMEQDDVQTSDHEEDQQEAMKDGDDDADNNGNGNGDENSGVTEALTVKDESATEEKNKKPLREIEEPEKSDESTCWEIMSRYFRRNCKNLLRSDDGGEVFAKELQESEYWSMNNKRRLELLKVLCKRFILTKSFRKIVDSAVSSNNEARADKNSFKRRYEEELSSLNKEESSPSSQKIDPERLKRRKEVQLQRLEKLNETEMQKFHNKQRKAVVLIRTELLGTDRHCRRYYLLFGEVLVVYDVKAHSWFTCENEQQLNSIKSWLNEKGIREKSLLERLEAVNSKIEEGFTRINTLLLPHESDEHEEKEESSDVIVEPPKPIEFILEDISRRIEKLVQDVPGMFLHKEEGENVPKDKGELLAKLKQSAIDLSLLKNVLLELDSIVEPNEMEDNAWELGHRQSWRRQVEGAGTSSALALCVRMYEIACPWSSLCHLCQTEVIIEDGITRSRQSLLCQQCHRKYHAKCLGVRVSRADTYGWLCPRCRSKEDDDMDQSSRSSTPDDDEDDDYDDGRSRRLPERRAKQAGQALTREMLHEQMLPYGKSSSSEDDDDDEDNENATSSSSSSSSSSYESGSGSDSGSSSNSDDDDDDDDDEDYDGGRLRRSRRIAKKKALERKRQRLEEEEQAKNSRYGFRRHSHVDYTE